MTVAFLLGAAAFAQPVPMSPAAGAEARTVSELLASQDPAHIAWGAYLAASYRLPEFSNDLLKLAVSQDWRLRMVAIDSLVRLNIDVPEKTLTEISAFAVDPVLIFIARRPDRYPALAKELAARKLQRNHWVALSSIWRPNPRHGSRLSCCGPGRFA